MCTAKTVTVNQTALKVPDACISGLIENTKTKLSSYESNIVITGSDNRSKARLQGFINETIDEKLELVGSENRFRCNLEDVALPHQRVRRKMEAMLGNEAFIPAVAKVLRNTTKKRKEA